MNRTSLRRVRFVAALAGICILSCILGSCQGGDKTPADSRKVIRISHWWGDAQGVWDEAIKEFEKTHKDIKVEQTVLSFNVHVQKVLTGAAAGSDVGDLILMEDWFAQELLARDF